MKIEYINGNLLESAETLIVHGCNAQGAYASGFAGAVKKMHPWAYDEYMRVHRDVGLALGMINWATDGSRTIGNMITQAEYGREPKQYVSYDAIRVGMMTVNMAAQSGIPFDPIYRHGFNRVCMPKIGSALGGGDWKIIEAIIEEELTAVQPVVYVFG